MGIEPTAGGCPATGFEVQERHQAANYSHDFDYLFTFESQLSLYCFRVIQASVLEHIELNNLKEFFNQPRFELGSRKFL